MQNEKIAKFGKWLNDLLYMICVTGINQQSKSDTNKENTKTIKLIDIFRKFKSLQRQK